MATKTKGRNRSVEAREAGRVLAAFELSGEANGLLDRAVSILTAETGRATRVQALEYLIRLGFTAMRKKMEKKED